ncbi:thioredoxin domain-containing protein [Candidatus Omnitrophota bacterium]
MRTKLFFAVFIICISIIFLSATSAYAIHWKYNLVNALKDAEKEDKIVLADFYATWCGPCKMMNNNTFASREVGKIAKEFICVKIDGDRHPDLVKGYNIRGYPTILFIRKDGKILKQAVGYHDAASFISIMQSVTQRYGDAAKEEPKEQEQKQKIFPWGKAKTEKEIVKKKSKRVFDLTGIVYDAQNPGAIINNELVYVGDSIGGARVLEINEQEVTLSKNGREIVLKME